MMNLLAHRKDGSEAIIQLENGQPYHYKFGAVDTYDLITDLTRTVGVDWEHDIDDPVCNNMREVKEYLQGYASGYGDGDDESMWNLPPGVKWQSVND